MTVFLDTVADFVLMLPYLDIFIWLLGAVVVDAAVSLTYRLLKGR